MNKSLYLCLGAALAAPVMAASPAERELVQAQVAAGLAVPSQSIELSAADRSFCVSGLIAAGEYIDITFVLTEDCCDWEINSCLSDETDTYFTSLVGPGISLVGYDDPPFCPRDCGSWAPDVMTQAYSFSNDGTTPPDCLPAGAYVLTVYSFSSFDPATCEFVDPGPFTVCINCEGDGGTVGADELPAGFALGQNYPNPFNPTTSIGFSLPETGEASLRVYDLTGREVATLVNGLTERGEHVVSFDASELGTGVYFYTLQAGAVSTTKKMVLVK
ncbi:MAG: T9SS type A sorting domain-containing protein [bacterium]|nr:T9SS type A sorting domain-containing protein [bacterium]